MKQVTERPTSGQFVEVYEYENELWSRVYRYVNGKLCVYNDDLDSFDEIFQYIRRIDSVYLVKD